MCIFSLDPSSNTRLLGTILFPTTSPLRCLAGIPHPTCLKLYYWSFSKHLPISEFPITMKSNDSFLWLLRPHTLRAILCSFPLLFYYSNHQEILLHLFSKQIQNLTLSHHLYCYHSGITHLSFLPGFLHLPPNYCLCLFYPFCFTFYSQQQPAEWIFFKC